MGTKYKSMAKPKFTPLSQLLTNASPEPTRGLSKRLGDQTDEVARLQAALAASDARYDVAVEAHRADQALLRRREEELEDSQGHVEHLEAELAKMKAERQSQVLHLAAPPAAPPSAGTRERLRIQTEKITQLEAENKRLALEIEECCPDDQTISVLEASQMQSALRSAEKKEQALKKVFNTKVNEFRVAMSTLFGYEIHWKGKQYTLRPVYAERESDEFVFTQQGEGMGLLETDLCQEFQAEIQEYVMDRGSVPGMLSAATLHMLSRQTNE